MFIGSYLYPFYRSIGYAYPYPTWQYAGYGNWSGFGNNNIIGSAIANQNQNVIGAGAIGGIQTATPTVIW